MHDVAIRMIHACGMVDLAQHIRASDDVVEKIEFALVEKAPDPLRLRGGALRHQPPLSARQRAHRHPQRPRRAGARQALGTTRSAAAVELWRDRLDGAIVVIGNAPTALFHLLELLDAGAPRPAAIIATPVGFVGAEEAKAELALDIRHVPFITLLGRSGGSAIASAALNAIARGIGT